MGDASLQITMARSSLKGRGKSHSPETLKAITCSADEKGFVAIKEGARQPETRFLFGHCIRVLGKQTVPLNF